MAEGGRPSIVNLRQIEFDDINNCEIVGRGSFGTVYKAQWQDQYVAVKEFYVTADPKSIETEVKQLSRVVHPNIIALYGVSKKNECIYLIMEYAEGGSLYNFLHGSSRPYYSAAHAMNWALQCAQAVAYLHAMKPKPLIHRDLKPPNLLLVNHGRKLKICDFGTVADKSTWMTNNKGSAAWMAPEVFEGSNYTEKCDVFSWGIILWELLVRQQPFKEVDHALTIMWGVHKGNRPPLIEGCPKPIEQLYTSCWNREPSSRPSMQHVVEIMTILCGFFTGADQPLDLTPNSQHNKEQSESEATINNSRPPFGPWSSVHSSQKTPTNSESVRHLTNMFNNLSQANSSPSPVKRSSQPSTKSTTVSSNHDRIEKENETTPKTEGPSLVEGNDPFRLTPSAETTKRNEAIRNGILKSGNLQLPALTVEVDKEPTTIFFDNTPKSDGRERLTVTHTKPVIPEEEDDLSNACSIDDDYEAEQSLPQMLDPSLQPEPPIPNNRQSQEIYREHTRLAKEYLRVVTELYYATDRRDKYLDQLDPVEREQKLTLMKKLEEKEELLELYNDLKGQLDRLRASKQNQNTSSDPQTSHSAKIQQTDVADSADDGWVLIPPKEDNT